MFVVVALMHAHNRIRERLHSRFEVGSACMRPPGRKVFGTCRLAKAMSVTNTPASSAVVELEHLHPNLSLPYFQTIALQAFYPHYIH